MATHAETHSTQGPQGPAGPAPTDSGNKVLATPSNGSSGVSSLRRIVPADVVADALVDGYLVNYQSGDGLLHVSDPGTITGLNAIKIRGVTVATAAATPNHGDLLEYHGPNAAWQLKRRRGGAQYGWRASGGANFATGHWGLSAALTAQVGSGPAAVVPTGTEPYYNSGTTSSAAGIHGAGVSTQSGLTKDNFGPFRYMKCRVQLPSTASIRVWVGMGEDDTLASWQSDTPNKKFVGFRYSSAAPDAGWVGVAQTSNTLHSYTTVGPNIDTAGHDLELFFDGTNLVFMVDGVAIGTTYSLTTNLPATTQGLGWIVMWDDITTGAKTVQIANLLVETV